jgi:hypothetical protein
MWIDMDEPSRSCCCVVCGLVRVVLPRLACGVRACGPMRRLRSCVFRGGFLLQVVSHVDRLLDRCPWWRPLPLSWRWVRFFGCGGPRSGLGSCPFLPSPRALLVAIRKARPVGTAADQFSYPRCNLQAVEGKKGRDDGATAAKGAATSVETTDAKPQRFPSEGHFQQQQHGAFLLLGAATLAPAPDEALGAFINNPFRFYIKQSAPSSQRLACRRSLHRTTRSNTPASRARPVGGRTNRPRTKGRSSEGVPVGGARCDALAGGRRSRKTLPWLLPPAHML